MTDYDEPMKKKVLRKVRNRQKRVQRGKDKKERKTSGGKPFIACVAVSWCILVLLELWVQCAGFSCTRCRHFQQGTAGNG